jgi:transcriptional regulator with XRE-family HTH domain
MQTDRVARLRFELVATEFLVRMGARIEEHRKLRGLSRADLARALPGKVNENQVYRWERGKHQPNPDTLQAIANVLEVDVAVLMAPEPEKAATPDLSSQPSNADIMAYLNRLEGLIRQLGLDMAARDLEAIERHEEALRPTPARRRQRQ